MHPRNRFSHTKPDFNLYAITRPSLRQYLKPMQGTQCTLNFNDPRALRELTCACLEHEFNLKVDIPLGHLIPTVPLRLNYIHWIEDLLNLLGGKRPVDNEVVGVDIGCGPVCVYPLLGSRLNGWSFVATEIQEKCVKFARDNVLKNKLNDKITSLFSVLQVTDDVILRGAIDQSPHDTLHYSFCMCNPPFYGDQSELSDDSKRSAVGHSNTGNEYETITEGGEVEFVKRIINDSLSIGNKIKWYTSMIGKKDSLTKIKSHLKESKIEVVMDTTFVQGKTHRWGVAWSFDLTLKGHVIKKVESNKRPHPYSVTIPSEGTINSYSKAIEWIKDTFTKLKIHYSEGTKSGTLVCKTTVNTWSKQRKRKRLLKRIEETKQSEETSCSSQLVEDLLSELNSLDTPCHMDFTCLVEQQQEETPLEEEMEKQTIKKRKLTTQNEQSCSLNKEESSLKRLLYSFEWLSGEGDRDELHQIVQIVHNWLN